MNSKEDRIFDKLTLLSVDDIVELLRFVLTQRMRIQHRPAGGGGSDHSGSRIFDRFSRKVYT